MKPILLVCCLILSSVSAQGSKKISLEDIERDNLRSEKRDRPPTLAPSPTQFGFVPAKTAQDYSQKSPKLQYVQPQYTVPQPVTGQVYDNAQKYISSSISQAPQYQQYQQTFYAQPQQYQNYENVQYVTDNSIAQKSTDQYYPQQYVYLQQYQAPSTAIQSVIDPKGQLQYIMYVPSYVADQSQNYENVVYADQPQKYEEPTIQHQQQQEYEEQPLNFEQSKTQYISPREPKSLLDSYVPSILQIQYYRQQQQRLANSLAQGQKTTQTITGKTNYVKSNYRSQRGFRS